MLAAILRALETLRVYRSLALLDSGYKARGPLDIPRPRACVAAAEL
ncbi:hypothetical protein PCL1606_22150 [Pseudomonas chlororaphis]|uniref:Uncharacterized protein n=1 Tax=Pseudomonas chlororaphis TaxID=587753 RepID=A0A0D5XX63_9PSED|nr:hypothetical protein PCL1606_22150 [Pseudomonas chlororaphis]